MKFVLDEQKLQITITWKSLKAALRAITSLLKGVLALLITFAAIIAFGAMRGWW